MYENSQTQVPVQQSVRNELEERVSTVFNKGLAAAIMCHFPVASIIAIFFGSKAVRLAAETRAAALQKGLRVGGRLTAGRILGLVGKIVGIVMTVIWGIYGSILFLYLCIYFMLLLSFITQGVFNF